MRTRGWLRCLAKHLKRFTICSLNCRRHRANPLHPLRIRRKTTREREAKNDYISCFNNLMLKLTSKLEIQAFVNSFTGGGSSLESAHSRRLLYLMDSKKHLVDKYTVVDVNTEIKKAFSENVIVQSTLLIRESLVTQFQLIRNSQN